MSKVTLPDTSATGPSLEYFDYTFVLAWASGGGSGAAPPGYQLNLARLPVTPTSQRMICDEWSTETPAMAVHNGRLFVAWTGTDPSHRINISSTTNFDSVEFTSTKQVLDETAHSNPALASYRGRLFLAWAGGGGLGGAEPNLQLNLMSSADGTNWSTPIERITLSHKSTYGPALAVQRTTDGSDYLFISWASVDRNIVYVSYAPDDNISQLETGWKAVTWDGSHLAGSLASPTMTSAGQRIYVNWLGANQALNSGSTDDGSQPVSSLWSHFERSVFSPAVKPGPLGLFDVATSFGLVYAWTGTDAANSLNVASFSDIYWRNASFDDVEKLFWL
jgi:hypothetical protein